MLPIIAMLLVVLFAGCEKDDDTGVRPTVTSTDPLNNESSVARNKVVLLTFSEAMDPLTINTSTFTLKQGTTAVSGTVAYSGTTATFTPSNPLAAVTTYTATITTGAKNLAGNALASNTVWSFTTGGIASSLEAVDIGAAGDLGAAGNYVILAKTAINNIPTSAITGEFGSESSRHILYYRICLNRRNRICNLRTSDRENICSRHGGSDSH